MFIFLILFASCIKILSIARLVANLATPQCYHWPLPVCFQCQTSNTERFCSNVNMGGVMFISVDSVTNRNDLSEYLWFIAVIGKMVMPETYYHLAEKDISRVSSIWKGRWQFEFVYIGFLNVLNGFLVGHICLLAAIAVSGFITAYTFGNTLDAFGNHCILFSKVILVERNTTVANDSNISVISTSTPVEPEVEPFRGDNKTLTISLKKTVWGSNSMCSFCQFTPVMSMIFALSWGVFFTICSKGGSGYPSDMYVIVV